MKKPRWRMLRYYTTAKGVAHIPALLNQLTALEARQAKVSITGNVVVVLYPELKKRAKDLEFQEV